nr:uncharacterized protein LOC121502915 [Drosophila kikkawai]
MVKTTNILSYLSEQNNEEDDEECTNDDYIQKIEFMEKVPYVLIGNIQVCRCAAHTAQLVAIDVNKSPDILKFILNCRNLTKYIRKASNGYRETFELKKLKMPQLDCPTKWGSTYTMLQNLLEAKDLLRKIESVKNKTDEDNFDMDSSFWDFIETYCNVFSPLQKSIKKFQEEQFHYSNFYAQWLKLKISTEKMVKDSTQDLTKTIGNKILNSIEIRTKTLLYNKFVVSCLFLDPRFQHILSLQQKSDAINHLKSIWDRLYNLNPLGHMCSTPNSSFNQMNNYIFDEEDELLEAYLSQGVHSEVNSIYVYTKIENLQLSYQRIDIDMVSYWKGKQDTDQELYVISNVCFAVPPTQVSIERAFSTLRLVLTDYRNRLSQDVLENILVVKLNPSFLDVAIDTLPLFENENK